METQAEVLEGNRAKVTVTVDAATISNRIKKQYNDYARRYSIPGFRKGKAPRPVIENFLGKGAVEAQVTDDIVNETCMVAIDKNDLYPAGQPDFGEDLSPVVDGKEFTYSFEIDLKPTPTLSSYDNVEIELPSAVLTDEEIQKSIDSILEHYPEIVNAAANTKIKPENFEDLKIAATDDNGENIESISTDSRQYRMGTGLFPQSFDDEIAGMKKGETKQFTIDVPAEPTVMTGSLIGKTEKINFDIEVLQVKKSQTPEFSDEWATKTIGMNKEELVEMLSEQKTRDLPRMKEERALAALGERLQDEVPENLVEQEEQALLQQFFIQLQKMGSTFDQYLQATGIQPQQFRDDIKHQAADRVKQDLALDAWAAEKGMVATDEDIDAEFARSGAEDPTALKKEWEESGQMFLVRQGVLRQKASDDVIDNAVVTDEAPAEEAKSEEKAEDAE